MAGKNLYSVHASCLLDKFDSPAQSYVHLYSTATNNITIPQLVWSYLDQYDHPILFHTTHE